MKKCLKCGQTYADDTLNFCLSDGELLVKDVPNRAPFDDTPPTIMLDPTRVTNPIDWAQSSSPVPWQGQPTIVQQGQGQSTSPYGQQYGTAPYGVQRDQTLPTISLVLAIISFFLVCCAGGVWLGLPAAIVGFIAMRNIDANPQKYTGRGMAIGGMVLGIVTFLASLLFLIFGQLS